MNVNGTEVIINGVDGVTEHEVLSYLRHIHEKNARDEITRLTISGQSDGNVALDYTTRPPSFQRIRRITGYLVGSIDRWNNAKRAEEHDRVKHSFTAA